MAVLVFVGLIGLVFLALHMVDILGQYRTYDYVFELLRDPVIPSSDIATANLRPESDDKIIVVAKLEIEETDWIKEFLPDWQSAIYVVNPSDTTPEDTLVTPLNKGHEAMAYLTYLIDNYDSLPSTIAFLHSHRKGFLKAWHTDAPLHDNVYAMRHLQLGFVQQNGYVNLRCRWNPGCLSSQRQNGHVTPEIWQTIFANTSTPPSDLYAQTGSQSGGFPMPPMIGVACCGQFSVSRQQVHKRPREDYVVIRNWLFNTELNDAKSGRVLEYLWHIIFAADAVYCPDEQACYCDVYQHCE